MHVNRQPFHSYFSQPDGCPTFGGQKIPAKGDIELVTFRYNGCIYFAIIIKLANV